MQGVAAAFAGPATTRVGGWVPPGGAKAYERKANDVAVRDGTEKQKQGVAAASAGPAVGMPRVGWVGQNFAHCDGASAAHMKSSSKLRNMQ